MTLPAGALLGPYEIVSQIGAGGMGEVYRARDTRLGRDVAVKVLGAQLSANPEIRARFEREARAISQISHPHICALYDVGREGDADYFVMELLEGESLAKRLERGPMKLEETLRIGVQIADALAAAHKQGIVHRDLKPGNIVLTRSGAKVLDFGVAKLRDEALAESAPPGALLATARPTRTTPLTGQGALIGTVQYMAPEQLEGQKVDHRADIFAFGAVLYEMLTGRRAFEGASQASLIAAVLTAEPRSVSEIVPLAPPALDQLIRRCLVKDADERWQSAHDIAAELRWITTPGGEAGSSARPAAPPARRRDRFAWTIAGVMAIAAFALAAVGVALWRAGADATRGEPLHSSIIHDADGVIENTPCNMAISPDGRRIAYVVQEADGRRLWVRDLESQTSRRLSDLDRAQFPFWSPDGRWVGFFTKGEPSRLWKAPAEGGAPLSLCSVTEGLGGSWSRHDVIVFAPTATGPLYRVSASGGSPQPVTTLDATRRQAGHRMPWFLPDGDHFLFAAIPRVGPDVEIFAGSLRSKQVKRVMAAATGATYADPGYLLFERDHKLVAQRFDASRLALVGEPVPIGEPPLAEAQWEATWIATASRDGRLAVLRSWPQRTEVEWVDRSGRRVGQVPLPAGRWQELDLAPDGRSVLAGRPVSALNEEIWLFDSEGAKAERVSQRDVISYMPKWAPDGRSFVYTSAPSGRFEVYRQVADRAEAPHVISTVDAQFNSVLGFTPDGATLILDAYDGAAGWRVWTVPLRGQGAPAASSIPLLPPNAEGHEVAVSPDGRWLAYTSAESGQSEIYLASFPNVGPRIRVSTGGGARPVWVRGGAELVYMSTSGRDASVLSAPAQTGPALSVGTPHSLFTRRGLVSFAATRDGERLLLSVESGETPPPRIDLTLNWTAAIKGR